MFLNPVGQYHQGNENKKFEVKKESAILKWKVEQEMECPPLNTIYIIMNII